MRTRNYEDWTVERGRIEPRFEALDFPDASTDEQAPPLWKDLTLAAIVALLLWIAAAAVFA